jgi:hypothetical protein
VPERSDEDGTPISTAGLWPAATAKKRGGAAPAPSGDETKIVPAPRRPDPAPPAFEEGKTLEKLEAVDVEIVEEDTVVRRAAKKPEEP